jgi:hypothetical protein
MLNRRKMMLGMTERINVWEFAAPPRGDRERTAAGTRSSRKSVRLNELPVRKR